MRRLVARLEKGCGAGPGWGSGTSHPTTIMLPLGLIVGGRITPATLRTMAMLGKVGAANASTHRPGDWNLLILHHTDCGMTDLAPFPDLLAEYFEIPFSELEAKSVSDPVESVRVDVDVILQAIHGTAFLVSGLVYDVDTGLIEVVVPPTPLSLA